jgi:hypothetical protein
MATTGQAFSLGFRCHGCQEFAVDFLVIRKVLKLTIAGRWPVETTPIPNHVPKECKKHYSNALVASNAGQVLAGIFLLRTFIEQYWVSLGLREEATRTTGQDMGSAYKALLTDDFKGRFPSLSELYDDLSVAIHSADANHELFQSSMEKIDEHFEAKKIFKIKDENLKPKSKKEEE